MTDHQLDQIVRRGTTALRFAGEVAIMSAVLGIVLVALPYALMVLDRAMLR
tara:strand:- start:12307 stop:12459 length:153 start_codon:yes stop_codon:yes gene_type:complete